jgi:hypothetical protein
MAALAAEDEDMAAERIGANNLLHFGRQTSNRARRSIDWQARNTFVPGGRAIIRTPAMPTIPAAAPPR